MQAPSFRGSTVVFPTGVYLNVGRNVEVCVDYKVYYSQGGWADMGDVLPLQAIIEVFQALKRTDEARKLTDWLIKCHQENSAREEYTVIPEQLRQELALQLVGAEYEEDPFDQVGCVQKAVDRGEIYHPPTSGEFLRTAARSLARFETPYLREQFLAKPTDLRQLYGRYCEREHGRRESMIQKLQKCISEEANREDVSLREVNRDDLKGRMVEQPQCQCREHDFFLELKIGDQVRYLSYRSGAYPFCFLTPLHFSEGDGCHDKRKPTHSV